MRNNEAFARGLCKASPVHFSDSHRTNPQGLFILVPKAIFEVMPGIAFLAVIPALTHGRIKFGVEPWGELLHGCHSSASLILSSVEPRDRDQRPSSLHLRVPHAGNCSLRESLRCFIWTNVETRSKESDVTLANTQSRAKAATADGQPSQVGGILNHQTVKPLPELTLMT